MDPFWLQKQLQSDPERFLDRAYVPIFGRKKIKDGCVMAVHDGLKEEEFDVEIQRDLCYPSSAPI
jgi:hypothetical protein